jgi:hypothetical protein
MAFTGRTLIGDNVVVPVLVDAVSAAFPNNPSVFVRSGAMIQDLSFPPQYKGVKQVEVPTFARMPEAVEVEDGTPVEPNKLTSSGEYADVREFAIAFSLTDRSRSSQLGTYEEGGRQCMISIAEKVDSRALTQVRAASWLSDYTVDVFSASTPVNFTSDTYIAARQKLGDVGWNEAPVMVAIHSDVMATMTRVRNASGTYDLVEEGPPGPDGMPMWLKLKPWGTAILVSDKLDKTLSGGKHKYESFVIWRDSIAVWLEASPSSEQERIAKVAADSIYMRQFGIVHPYARRPGKKTPGIVRCYTNAVTV